MVELPVVDLTPLRTGDGDLDALVDGVDRAARELGAFAVVGHGVEPELRRDLFESTRSAFAQTDTSERGSIVVPVGGGGSPTAPGLPSGLRTVVAAYRVAGLEATLLALRGIALALGVRPGYFDRHMRAPVCALRLSHDPPDAGVGDLVRGAGTVTLVATDGIPALRLGTRSAGRVDVNAPAESLVVVLGDLLGRWTNDRYHAPAHRVLPSAQHRYAAHLAVDPEPETVVRPLRSCVDDDHPAAYEPVTAGAYLGAPSGGAAGA